MIEEIEPRHDAVVGVEAFNHLLGDVLDVTDQSVVRSTGHLVRVDRAFKRTPVCAQGAIRFGVSRFGLFFGRDNPPRR